MEKYLNKLYKKFVKFEENEFLRETKDYFSTSGEVPEDIKLPSQKQLKIIYQNYYKESFFSFLKKSKDVIYSSSPFDFILKNSTDRWNFINFIEFLKREKILDTKNDKVILLNKNFSEMVPAPMQNEEIKNAIERKLEKGIDLNAPSNYLFQTKIEGEKYDQLPISTNSAISVVKKILDYLPLKKTFLFIGDDDLISIYLSLANPEIECLVIDIDENLLTKISQIAQKYNLKIKTQRVDVQKTKKLKGEFTGFLVNPVYNYDGAKQFFDFGTNHLGKNGGYAFLEIGDESIGNKFLFLQNFFTKKNLIIQELLKEKSYYPYFIAHPKEDQVLNKKFRKFFSQKAIETHPILGASLWIFEYIPFKVAIPKKQPFYIYI